MDTQKKIIVAVVGVIMALIAGYTLKKIFFKPDENLLASNKSITGNFFKAPEPKKDIKFTKKQLYDKESKSVLPKKPQDTILQKITTKDELDLILELQENLDKIEAEDNPYPASSFKVRSSQRIPQQSQRSQRNQQNQQNQSKPAQPVEETLLDPSAYFYSAKKAKKKPFENLIPAETVSSGIVSEGSTIAIRTEAPIHFQEEDVVIPKGAVIYGVTTFSASGAATRINIDIAGYRRKNRLFKTPITVYDYDSRIGIHVDNKGVFKIPGNVAKDVYEFMYQRGTQQQGALGGGNTAPTFDDAKVIALLSATKEIGQELFIKRKAFVPRKYKLWLSINDQSSNSLNTALPGNINPLEILKSRNLESLDIQKLKGNY